MYVEDFFELNKVAKWAEDNCLKLVALQLPDEHLKFAFKISQYLEEKCKETKFYVLADTSFQRFYYGKIFSLHTLFLVVALTKLLQSTEIVIQLSILVNLASAL